MVRVYRSNRQTRFLRRTFVVALPNATVPLLAMLVVIQSVSLLLELWPSEYLERSESLAASGLPT